MTTIFQGRVPLPSPLLRVAGSPLPSLLSVFRAQLVEERQRRRLLQMMGLAGNPSRSGNGRG
uniref:Uncharacterized protein n=1 Tax=Arundo donax TaxID=35708 RepID=A0A0A9BGP4_ARUDO